MRYAVVAILALCVAAAKGATPAPPSPPAPVYSDVLIKDVPHVKQKPDFCGEACAEMALARLGNAWSAVGQETHRATIRH